MLERLFKLSQNKTTVRTELLAGVTTFMTLAYIVFVQPQVLSGGMPGMKPTGMDFGAIMVATCLAGALATFLMGVYANYPIAQAPGMGENFFFVFSVIPAAALVIGNRGLQGTTPWQIALGVVFISGVLFLILSLLKVRQVIIDAVSPSLKNGIAVGIGLFIAFIGLRNAGVVIASQGTLVTLTGRIVSKEMLVFCVGLAIMSVLHARRVRGSILWGIIAGTAVALALKKVEFAGVFSRPPSIAPTFLKMDLAHAAVLSLWPYIIIFLFMDMFDTIGTLIGVSEQAGFIKDNKLPRAGRALLSDAVGTVAGAAMGTSTVTSFIESATGVEYGGRTGLTSVSTACCFLLALFLSPIVAMVANFPPITAPALVIVGAMMFRNVVKIDWSDYTESIPAFLTMIGIPLTYNIANGLAFGFISYPLIKLLAGRGREVHPLSYVLCAIFIARYIFLQTA